MNRWYSLREPLQGARVEGGRTHIVHLPVGASVRLVRRYYRNVGEVEHNGRIIIVFYDDLRLCGRIEKEIKPE